jgi:hypothetical protein
MDVPANTDTNILSEVRLSAIDDEPTSAEDPYDFIRGRYTFSVGSHLGADAVDRLYELGTYYLSRWNEEKMAQLAADQLQKLDAVKARGIEYQKLWGRFEFKQADALYQQYELWPDLTHMQQALSLADRGRFDEAHAVVPQIKEEGLRRTLFARLWFEEGRYDELIATNARYDAEKLWRLSALAKKDLMSAGTALHALVQRVSPWMTQMRVLAGYYGALNDGEQLDRMARLIIKEQNWQIDHIRSLVDEAIEDGQNERAKALLLRLERHHPEENYELKDLRAKVAKLADTHEGEKKKNTEKVS